MYVMFLYNGDVYLRDRGCLILDLGHRALDRMRLDERSTVVYLFERV